MARPGRTQKQIAERYKGNLGYYNKPHLWRRARLVVSLLAICGALLAIWWFSKHGRETFFNTGKISRSHSTFANDCAKCHDRPFINSGRLTPSTFAGQLRQRFRQGLTFDSIDRKCETCHKQHSFHEANVAQNRSCSACHQEHEGPGPLKLVASANCASCHAQRDVMEAAAQKGTQLPATAFHRHPPPPWQAVFELPRPPRGYTQVFQSLAGQHPEFQLISAKPRDPDVLRFNHERHFAADIPLVSGQKLDCNNCHKPEPGGRFFQRISFARDCQACHSLQFDARNPELKIPHGDVALVRTFLRTLPAQYADYARLKKEKVSENEVRAFVAQQIRQLREQFRTGDELEQAVFFTTNPYKPQEKSPAATGANFAGCAFCHDVKAARNTAPSIPKPVLIDRWMPQAEFNHAKHVSVKCDDCHRARQSRDTSDILIPAKAKCVTCHSPAGKVASECITCHKYHAPPAAQTVADAPDAAPAFVK